MNTKESFLVYRTFQHHVVKLIDSTLEPLKSDANVGS